MAKQKPKMGRPPKPKGEKYSAQITVRMTQETWAQMIADADKAGMSISAYLLECWQKNREKK